MLLDNREVAAMLKVGQTTLWRLRRTKGLPCVKIAGQVRFDRDKVLAWVEQQAQSQAADETAEA